MNRFKKVLNEKGIKQTRLTEQQQPPLEPLYQIARIWQVTMVDACHIRPLYSDLENIAVHRRKFGF
jgi:hypothetical protein